MGRMQSKGHAIMISVPFQGHINPFVDLALKLASKGFTITFVHLQYAHYKLSKSAGRHHSSSNGGITTDDHEVNVDLFSEARESGLDIRYTTISDGLPLEFDRDLHFDEYWEIMFRDFPARFDEFVGKMIIDQSAADDHQYFLVTDTVYAWISGAIAHKYDMVDVSFWTQPALVFSLAYHWDLLTQRAHSPSNKDKIEEINYIPRVKSINTKDLPSYIKEDNLENAVYKTMSLSFERVKKADFIIHNTVEELEPDILWTLNKYQPNYAIGPINFSTNTVITKSLRPESDCTHWLESKSPASVLYVSFGSLVQTSKHIVEEIAYGLVLSEVNFIWVVREGILNSGGDANYVLPVGLEHEIGDKGLIVPWCDQIKVLSNPAVGGFLTHNGWNSTVESMWCGVPMICYPIAFDQPTNRKLVVDDWKIGINLCDDHGISVHRIEVAYKIKNFMSTILGRGSISKEAHKVKGAVRKALEPDGSSEKNFDRFIKDLEAKIDAKTTNVNKCD